MMATVASDGTENWGQTVRRQLHFFWIVDESLSMKGQRIQAVNYAIKNVLPEIQKIQDDQRIDIVMRAIAFGEHARWYAGPTPVPIADFTWRDLTATGSATNTSHAIEMLASELELNKIGTKNVPPVAILLSDGRCTDEEGRFEKAIAALDGLPWGQKAVRVAIGIGASEDDYDKEQLDQFISPYLRKESNLETLAATDVRKLVEYIKTASTIAATASATSKSDLQDQAKAPVQFDSSALNTVNDPTAVQYPPSLDPNQVL